MTLDEIKRDIEALRREVAIGRDISDDAVAMLQLSLLVIIAEGIEDIEKKLVELEKKP